MRMTQVSSGFTTTQALTSVAAPGACAAASGTRKPKASPPLTTAVETTNSGRDSWVMTPFLISLTLGRLIFLAYPGCPGG